MNDLWSARGDPLGSRGGVPPPGGGGPLMGVHFDHFWVIFDHFGVILVHFGVGGGTPPRGGGFLAILGVKKWRTKGPPLVVQLFGLFHRGFLRSVFGG